MSKVHISRTCIIALHNLYMEILLSDVYRLTIILLASSFALKNMEYMSMIRAYSTEGVFSFRIVGSDVFYRSGYGKFFERLYSDSGLKLLITISLTGILTLVIIPFASLAFKLILTLVLIINFLIHRRHKFGLDGADQMNVLLSITVLTFWILPVSNTIQIYGIYFIAVQLSLSYLVAGVAKLFSTSWRSGQAVKGIFSTYMFGSYESRLLTRRHPAVNQLLCWLTIIFEITFPLGLLFGGTGALIVLAIGFSFHLANAFIMGLNDFLWSFTSFYPAFYFAAVNLEPIIY